jgi:glutamine synthetase
MRFIEYLWRDERSDLRSKTVVSTDGGVTPVEVVCGPLMFESVSLSTPDVYLSPVRTYPDPFRPEGVLALCEVFRDAHLRSCLRGERAALEGFMVRQGSAHDPVVGVEQSALLSGEPPAVDIGYYGRAPTSRRLLEVAEAFLAACAHAGIALHSFMWGENPNTLTYTLRGDPVEVADDLLIARWILSRVCCERDTHVHLRGLPDYAEAAGFDLRLGVTLSTVFSRGPASAVALLALRDALGGEAEVPYSSKFDPSPYVRLHEAPAASDPYALLLDVLSKTCASRAQVFEEVAVG